MKYNPEKIEKKWQKQWEKEKLYQTPDTDSEKENYMLLTEFPYPSGNLHIGHWYAFALPDILARYLRMTGKNVMYPIGFDAFGLPAENAAIQRNINPRDWTEENIKYMAKQFRSMGASFDWSREVRTIDPEYYKWTQWMFLKFYEKGLAYRAKTMVNWCPSDKTVLANEQVIDGKCERDGTPVVQRELEQWMFKITDYADRLIDELEELDWPETTKLAQKNWIGRSQGALIKFKIANSTEYVEVFTTRPDTIFGATYLVLAPEHSLIEKLRDKIENWDKVMTYVREAQHKTERQRIAEAGEKSGIELEGIEAVNPANNEPIPIWAADYVIAHYGTGAIMAVPAHDERDREFADKFHLPSSDAPLEDPQKIIKILQKKGMGQSHKTYRLHDWILSRQRYWGVPIPVIRCDDCGYVPVPEDELPIKLPDLDDYKPSDDGRSPLAKAKDWVKVQCSKCGKTAERETDTMDTFVDSSWYFIRYPDPNNKREFAGQEKIKQWLPVPLYIGGAEHNTMHLLYSRFFTKALFDLGYIDFSEPFLIRRNHGIILGPDSQKMSKSRGNVVDPDMEVEKYGADTVRMYLAFMAPYNQGGPWDPKGINGVFRFLHRVWKWAHGEFSEDNKIPTAVHRAIKNISHDIEHLEFNTGVSELMKLLNAIQAQSTGKRTLEIFLKLLSPFAPHVTEELWQEIFGEDESIHNQPWPDYDESVFAGEPITIPVQVDGKVRDTLNVPLSSSEDHLKELVLESKKVKQYLKDKKIENIIVIPGRMINVVTKN